MLQKLPFPDSYFYLVVSWTVLIHIPPNEMQDALAELKRVSRPDAVIIATERVDKVSSTRFWEHTFEEWKNLSLQWGLKW